MLFGLAACASPTVTGSPSPRSTPTGTVRLSFQPRGIVRCGIIPDWVCTYFILLRGADGVVHEGWFDFPPFGTLPPSFGIVGDVPTQLAPGTYRVTFLKQRVSDVVDFSPVPGGTPRLTNRGEVYASCETTLEATGAADVRVAVVFEESTCSVSSTVTPHGP
jgi:hypothetical protein